MTDALVDGIAAREVAAMVPPQEGELYRLAVPCDPNRASLNRRMHWSARSAETIQARELTLMFWRIDRFVADPADYPVSLQLWVLRARRLDDDACITGAKAIVDGAFNARRHGGDGITPDDSGRFLRIEGARQLILPRFGRTPWTVLVVRKGDPA